MSTRKIQSVAAPVIVAVLVSVVGAQHDPTSIGLQVHDERGGRTLRQWLRPADMRSDDGLGYVARLRLGREGDRDSGTSRCILLENGKPLPYPRSLHAAIRQQGGGRYSHWTATQLYFSASDSSDPRTNGRKYELISDESFVRRTAQVTVTDSHTSFSWAASREARIRPIGITLRNLDQIHSIAPLLKPKGRPNLTSVSAILESITSDAMTDEETAIAIWDFLVDWRYHDYPAEPYAEVHDPVKLINVYGYGFCDDSAAAFCVLASTAGMRTRSYGLSGHVVAEAFYDDAWHMFDPDHQVYYRARDGHVASVAELETQTDLITREPLDPIGAPSARIAELYSTRENNRAFQAAASEPLELRIVLDPGDRVTFDFETPQRVHRRLFSEEPLPKSFGNGMLVQTRTLDATKLQDGAETLHVRWPYVVLGGELTLPGIGDTGDTHGIWASVSLDGKTWQPLALQVSGDKWVASIDAWIDQQPSAVYEYRLRIQGNPQSGSAAAVERCVLRTAFQFAPRAHQLVQPGANEIVASVAAADGSQLTDWNGLHVQLIWDELEEQGNQ